MVLIAFALIVIAAFNDFFHWYVPSMADLELEIAAVLFLVACVASKRG